jgi:DNA-binding transcriptional MerR regulator
MQTMGTGHGVGKIKIDSEAIKEAARRTGFSCRDIQEALQHPRQSEAMQQPVIRIWETRQPQDLGL